MAINDRLSDQFSPHKKMNAKRFAAFIMTYERADAVRQMIAMLMNQTFPPEKILVVDNSDTLETEKLVGSIQNFPVDYLRVGYNSGPAGAARIGLEYLTAQGYDWIYWGDDDDPPGNQNDFKALFNLIDRADYPEEKIGVVGMRAGKFNRLTARTTNFANKELGGVMEADYVPGNHVLLVNSRVARQSILPSEYFFFGFEELDFCLRVKVAGFKILFDGDAILSDRIRKGNTDPGYRWRGRSIGDMNKLWRQYYSTRNMLKILQKNGLWIALTINIGRTFVKSMYGFRFGWKYGSQHFKIQTLALGHFLLNRFGKANLEKFRHSI